MHLSLMAAIGMWLCSAATAAHATAPLSLFLTSTLPSEICFFPPTLLALFNCPRSCAPYTLPPCAARLETLLWPPPARGFFWPMSKGRGIRP
ncbi:hypothetical protein B0H14DRAFT_2873484 [Mycena olivaceomarginata]|nr:hypothetical protein B0H14DRAFT_2873484 [Mycena olivaceomarginata]